MNVLPHGIKDHHAAVVVAAGQVKAVQVHLLEDDLLSARSVTDMVELADVYKTTVLEDMRALRISVDEMETVSSSEAWPYPSYGDLLFGVR